MKTKVLLAESDLIIQFFTEKMLLDLNCTVDIFRTSSQALAHFKENPKYHLIITGMDFINDHTGDEFAQKIREFEKEFTPKKRVPIIGLLSPLNAKIKERCYERGIDMMFRRPMTKETLEEILRVFVRRKEQ
jgi:CheY-like chemotaxis protein